MKKQWKDKWIKALLSGEYAQGKGALCTEGKKHGKFCCLGVLCDIAGPNKWRVSGIHGEVCWGRENAVYLPPDYLVDKVGLSDAEVISLANLNDNGKKFKTIAKYIEEYL
jgi:hypothetical protein